MKKPKSRRDALRMLLKKARRFKEHRWDMTNDCPLCLYSNDDCVACNETFWFLWPLNDGIGAPCMDAKFGDVSFRHVFINTEHWGAPLFFKLLKKAIKKELRNEHHEG